MSQPSPTPDAWTRARDRFTEDLDEEEKCLYFTATPETLLYEISVKEKIHGEKSKSRRLISSIQPFIDSIDHFGKALDVFTNTYPLVMSPLWGSFRIVIILAHDAGHYFDDVIDMIVKIGNVLPRLHVYESLFPNHERLVQVLCLIYCDLLTFCDEAKKVLRKPKRSMLSITFKGFERKFKKLLLQFQEHEKSVEKEVRTSHMIESADSRSLVRLDQLQAAAERKETDRWQVFANLSDIDYEAQYARLDDLRHEGTCEWIANEPLYKAWKLSKASSGLCYRGIPGSGKSVLMAKIITDQRACPTSVDDVTLFHFCDFAQPATLQMGQVYRAILKQLYANSVMQETLIEKIVKGFKQNPHGMPEKQLQALVVQAIETCKSQKVTVVCDGLDECKQLDQRIICDMLNCLAMSNKSCIKVLVTCREEERPLAYLKAFGQLHLTPDISHADMETFVVGAVQSCIERGDMTLKNPALRQEIISELVLKADGMFLWIHFQLLDLCEAASDAWIRETLRNLPRGLDETYNRILYKASKSVNAENVKFALRWIACARRPLKVEELQEAAAFIPSSYPPGSPDQKWDAEKILNADKLLQSCHGLIVRDRDGAVRFAHHTVRQFLLGPSPEADETLAMGQAARLLSEKTPVKRADLFRFTRSQAETSIAELCATYLCFSDFESALTTTEKQQNLTINAIFKQGGPVAIPANLGFRRNIYDIPYRFLGGKSDFKVPDIDFVKHVRMKLAKVSPSSDFRAKYALLGYVVEHWAWHTNQKVELSDTARIDPGHWNVINTLHMTMTPKSSIQRLLRVGSLPSFGRFWRLVKNSQLAFEIRPWGLNQHFGPYGCLGCPPPLHVLPSGPKNNPKLDGTSAIHWAAQNGHLSLLASFSDELSTYMNHEQYSQQTLSLACQNGHAGILALLLCHSPVTRTNDKAFQEACCGGHLTVLRLLIEGESRIKDPSPWHRRIIGVEQKHLAHFAAEFGHVHILQYILESHREWQEHILENNQGWQVSHIKDRSGRTIFHYAAMNGHYEIIDELLNHGVGSYDAKCWDQTMTPLMLAAQNGHAKAARALLAAGADPKARGGSKFPIPLDIFPAPLMEANDRYKGIDTFKVNELAPMAVHLAARYGHAEVLEVLPIHAYERYALSTSKRYDDADSPHGQPQRIKNRRFELSALNWAVMYGHSRAVEVLLSRDCDTNGSGTPFWMTSMHYAAATDHGEVIKVLLKYGATWDPPLEYGEAPLHIDALAALIKAENSGFRDLDSRVEERSEWAGMSALHIALLKGHNEIAQTLLSAGASPIQELTTHLRLQDIPEMDMPEMYIPEMAPLKFANNSTLGIASASSVVNIETLKQLYEATMNDFGRQIDVDTRALVSAIRAQQPEKLEALLSLGAKDGPSDPTKTTAQLPKAMVAAIDTEQEVMVQILLNWKDLYLQREKILFLAKEYMVDYTFRGRMGRFKRIIAIIDQEISSNAKP